MLWWQGVLSNPDVPQPLLLDAARFSETGHLSQDAANRARGGATEIGAYQIRSDNLNKLGYGMPTNFDVKDLEDPTKARGIASDYITRFSKHHGFTTPFEKLAAYNMGATKAARWKEAGAKFEDLPATTQKYVLRAARYIDDQQKAQQQPQTEVDKQMTPDQLRALIAQQQALGISPQDELRKRQEEEKRRQAAIQMQQQVQAAAAAGMDSEMSSDVGIQGQPMNRDTVSSAATQIGNTLVGQNARPTGGGILVTPAQAATLNGSPDPNDAMTMPPQNMEQFDPSFGALTTSSPEDDYYTGDNNNVAPLGGNPNAGALSLTGDTRSMTAFSLPRRPSGATTGEMLVRMGAAGMGGAMTSAGDAMSAIGKEYGSFRKEQRADEMERYKSDNTLLGKLKNKMNASAAGGSSYQENVLGSISSIEKAVKSAADDWNPFNNVTGFIGNALSYVAGTPAHDVASMIEQVEANIGFDRLQKMRDESPTGGALGSVSEKELGFLKSSLASLRQSQSREQFMYNLQRVKEHYQKATQAIDRQRQAYQGGLIQQGQQISGGSSITTSSGNNIQVRRLNP